MYRFLWNNDGNAFGMWWLVMNIWLYMKPILAQRVLLVWIILHIGVPSIYLCNPYANNPLDFSASLKYMALFSYISSYLLSVILTYKLFSTYRDNPFKPIKKLELSLFLGVSVILHLINLSPILIYIVFLSVTYIDLNLILLITVLKLYFAYFYTLSSTFVFIGIFSGVGFFNSFINSSQFIVRKLVIVLMVLVILVYEFILYISKANMLGYFSEVFFSQNELIYWIYLFTPLFLILILPLIFSRLKTVYRVMAMMGGVIITSTGLILFMPDPVEEKKDFELDFSIDSSNESINTLKISTDLNNIPVLDILNSKIKFDESYNFTGDLKIESNQTGKHKIILAAYMNVDSVKNDNNINQDYVHKNNVLIIDISRNTSKLTIKYSYTPNIDRLITEEYVFFPSYEAWYPRNYFDSCTKEDNYLEIDSLNSEINISPNICFGVFSKGDFYHKNEVIVPIKWSGSLDKSKIIKKINNQVTESLSETNKTVQSVSKLVIETKSEYNSGQGEDDVFINGGVMTVKIDPFIPLQDVSIEHRIINLVQKKYNDKN